MESPDARAIPVKSPCTKILPEDTASKLPALVIVKPAPAVKVPTTWCVSLVVVVVTLVVVPVALVYPPVVSSLNRPLSDIAAVPAPVPQPTYPCVIIFL